MVALEKVVRPFETRVTASAFAVPSTREPPKNVVLQYGKNSGSADILQSHFSFSITYYMTKKWSEFFVDSEGDPFQSFGYDSISVFDQG